ncbi:hypothetical protein PUN28_018522 [Cardiocondyla obscurior]|uniref:Uncharacterized protein n=1 Tax=Cardiocondyla obscurior TaxID=286306 RepID=A0AAW2EE90_9HYME
MHRNAIKRKKNRERKKKAIRFIYICNMNHCQLREEVKVRRVTFKRIIIANALNARHSNENGNSSVILVSGKKNSGISMRILVIKQFKYNYTLLFTLFQQVLYLRD